MQFEKEINKLWTMFQSYTSDVKNSFRNSILSLETRDNNLAMKVIEGDRQIDLNEVEIEESCLKILALYQPVAKDLRHIIAILKINDELERIADLGCNIARRTLDINANKPLDLMVHISQMLEIVEKMLEKSVDALFKKDLDLALEVINLDLKVDQLHSQTYKNAEDLHKNSQNYLIQDIFSIISVSRFIERAADHTTNIAENVVYFLTGEIYRHRDYTELTKQLI